MNDIHVCDLCGYAWGEEDCLEFDPWQRIYVCVPGEGARGVSPCQTQRYVDDDGEPSEYH